MRDLLVLLALARGRAGWMALGAGFALTATATGIALLGLAGGLVAGAGAGIAVGAIAWLRALALGRTAARYLERLTTHEATFRVLADLRLWFFERAIPLAPARLGGWRGGDLMARLVSDIDALDGLYLRLVTPTAVALLTVVGLAAVLGSLSPAIAVPVVALLALAGLGVPALTERAGRGVGGVQVAAAARLRVAAVDLVQGMADLAANQALDRQAAVIAEAEAGHEAALHRQAAISAAGTAATQLVSQLALVAVVLGWAALASGAGGTPLVAVAVLVTLAAFEAVAPLPLAWQLLGRTKAAARRIREVAEAAPAVCDPVRKGPPPASNALALEAVSFRYPGAERPALDGVDLAVPDGGRLGIAGPSGAGKSTLLALLLRFHDPDAGRVTLGGVDLRDLAVADLHARIGVLSQATSILAGSLRENLAIAAPEADEATLRAALDRAGLGTFLAALPDGLDTWLGEAGVAVSGGEARRIALARVLLKDAPILLLDEPTEGLDAETERAVLAALAPAMQGRTVVTISHRPAPLAAMDRVARLEAGRIVEATD
ncbi:thiol reductant ABC exporter subunit CydC [Thalassobaculum fulvum]|uniref:Thiol reductant ABC exporter subunit CydC n=1 Tax=Thalassobaculum fulvum TaxID=1633335 RepID=A0A919CSI1_9PROT|nr:thiol reductant ABC exporter subunit CydC [Thalassobaculum fulvum]GHD62598.1 thiol reductant ABC exporter subunit CydC [Thalassobaculum fulvum]